MDILFLLDGSYSVGKGSFERSKHYAIKLCQALDIAPDKVCLLLLFCVSSSLPLSLIYTILIDPHPDAGRRDSVWFLSSAGNRPGLIYYQTRAEEAHEEDFLQVCLCSPYTLR